jgi:hypothetical protein
MTKISLFNMDIQSVILNLVNTTLILRVRFPIVSLEFFIEIILSAALWPRGLTQPPTEMSTRHIYCVVKAAGR